MIDEDGEILWHSYVPNPAEPDVLYHTSMFTPPFCEWTDDELYDRWMREPEDGVWVDCKVPHNHTRAARNLFDYMSHRDAYKADTLQQFVGLVAAIKVRRDCVLNQSKHK
jgi:hypothetical protein